MKPNEKNIIKNKFAAISSKDDLVLLINEANKSLIGENAFDISYKTINYYANPNYSKKRYQSFKIKKKNGGERIINAPKNGLKNILRPLNYIFQCIDIPHHKATGFVPGKSIVDNAKHHINSHYVYNIDLKDFFHSFDRNRVKLGFMKAPFNLKDELEPIAFLLASLCTHPFEIENGGTETVLPQGSPTSPTITNILCHTLDRRLNGLAKRFNISYSRYADDITFSSQTNVFAKKDFLDELHRIIVKDQDFKINEQKVRLQKTGYRQEVTGLVVNSKVNVTRRYVKQLRMWLYYLEKYEYSKAESIFIKSYKKDKGHLKKKPNFLNVISGKLEYLKMVKGQNDSTYLKLHTRFEKITQNGSLVELLLNEWELNGIESAMKKYKTKAL